MTAARHATRAACAAALLGAPTAVAQAADPTLDALARRAEESSARAAAASRAPRRWAIELGAFGGAGASLQAGTGYVAGVEALLRLDVAGGALAVGPRVAWSQQGISVRVDLPCTPSGSPDTTRRVAPEAPCLSQAPGGRFEASVSRRFVRLGLPLSWRFGASGWRVQPYVTFAPEVVFETREPDPFAVPLPRGSTPAAPPPPPPPPPPPGSPTVGTDPQGRPPASTARAGSAYVPDDREDIRFALHGLVGLRVRLGPGALFAEVGYAFGTTRASYGPVTSTHALDALAGYRLEL